MDAHYKEITLEQAESLFLMGTPFECWMSAHRGSPECWYLWTYKSLPPSRFPEDRFRVEVE